MNKLNGFFIECPHCKAQYLPSEIFMPKEFLGSPENIMKTANGTIEYYSGDNMDLNENFTCDYCNTNFNVEAVVNFKTSVDELSNFNEDYSSTIFKDRIVLAEDKATIVKEDLFTEDN